MRTARSFGGAVALLAAILLFIGCGDDSSKPSTTGTLRGTVTLIADGSPVAGVTLALVDPGTLRLSAPATVTAQR